MTFYEVWLKPKKPVTEMSPRKAGSTGYAVLQREPTAAGSRGPWAALRVEEAKWMRQAAIS